MATLGTLKELHGRLREDAWRNDPGNDFSSETKVVHSVLFHPYSKPSQKQEVLARWLQRYQPCLFGRVAAAKDWIHYCFITKEDILQKSDKEIAQMIRDEWLAWQRRSLRPTTNFSEPAHGFLLLVISDRVSLAAPDENLRAFSEKVRDLWGCPGTRTPQGVVHWETLFLQNPADKTYLRFTFGVDFFASQGDGRWWQDHRIPGGIGFTANSVGHMRRFREWYLNLPGQEEWVLRTAMGTIDSAAKTSYGQATWLKPLESDGTPLVKDQKCPFSHPEKLEEKLQGKDWTRYGGFLHTDHSIRDEFFHNEADKVREITRTEYLEDFTYLYDPRVKDHLLFVKGEAISEDEVYSAIGNPASYVTIYGSKRKSSTVATQSTDPDRKGFTPPGEEADELSPEAEIGELEVEQLLGMSTSWPLQSQELTNLLKELP